MAAKRERDEELLHRADRLAKRGRKYLNDGYPVEEDLKLVERLRAQYAEHIQLKEDQEEAMEKIAKEYAVEDENGHTMHSLSSEADGNVLHHLLDERTRNFALDIIVRAGGLREKMSDDVFNMKGVDTAHVKALDEIIIECKSFISTLDLGFTFPKKQ